MREVGLSSWRVFQSLLVSGRGSEREPQKGSASETYSQLMMTALIPTGTRVDENIIDRMTME